MTATGWISSLVATGTFLLAIIAFAYQAWRRRAIASDQREKALIAALDRQTATVEALAMNLPATVATVRQAVIDELERWRRESLLSQIDELRRDRPT